VVIFQRNVLTSVETTLVTWTLKSDDMVLAGYAVTMRLKH